MAQKTNGHVSRDILPPTETPAKTGWIGGTRTFEGETLSGRQFEKFSQEAWSLLRDASKGTIVSPYLRPVKGAMSSNKVTKMSDDAFHRPEMEARFREQEAKTEKRFAELLGEMRTANAQVRGSIDTLAATIAGDLKTLPTRADIRNQTLQIIAVVVALFAVAIASIIAMEQSAQQGRSEGIEIRRDIDAAVQERLDETRR